MAQRLTDRTLQALKPASGKRYDLWDTDVRGLGVRVNDKGRRTFVLIARFPRGRHPTRRRLGEYPDMSLSEAREEGRRWKKLIADGIDPAVERERKRREEDQRQENTFEAVCTDYFADLHRRKLRRAGEVERDIRREFMSLWGKLPITDITRRDVLAVIDAAIARGSPWQAHHLHSYASRLFNWAIDRDTYGLDRSPCERMRPAKIIGPKEPRTRVLTDAELRAMWNAAGKIGYPFGPFVRLLLLTGQRRTEVAEARWSEIDLTKRMWTIPHARMKAGAAHGVPLTDDAMEVLDSLPRFARGDHLFTTTYGAKAINGFSKAKARLDRLMSEELGHTVEGYVLHDARRSMRTHLSALPIPDIVRELVIGHTQKGLHKVYDLWAYESEKRQALELWAARLRAIVT